MAEAGRAHSQAPGSDQPSCYSGHPAAEPPAPGPPTLKQLLDS